MVSSLIFAAGAGLIGSGMFMTDPVAGFPPPIDPQASPSPRIEVTRKGMLHDLCGIPIFIGIPGAALICAGSAARSGDYRWAASCVGSASAMFGLSLLSGAAFNGAPRLAERGGILQRISIAAGFGWLSSISLRALRLSRGARVLALLFGVARIPFTRLRRPRPARATPASRRAIAHRCGGVSSSR